MKIYIVTRGCYSDYCIETVFTVKEKAEEYVKYNKHNSFGSDMRIEEYDTSDDYSCEGYITAKCHFIINENCTSKREKKNGRLKINRSKEVNFHPQDIDIYLTETKKDFTYLSKSDISSSSSQLIITRSYKETLFTEEQVKNKVLKIGYDLCTKIKALYELEGYTLDDIIDYIINDITDYINNEAEE